VLSGRGLCDELITRSEESYRLCCVVVCDLETSRMGAPYIYIYIYIYDISRLRVKIYNKCGTTFGPRARVERQEFLWENLGVTQRILSPMITN